MSTIDAAAITALSRHITDISSEAGAHSRSLAAVLPADQWLSPAAAQFQVQLQALILGLVRVAALLIEAADLLLTHLHDAQHHEQEIAAAATTALQTAAHVAGSAATQAANSILAPFGFGAGAPR